MRLGIHIRTAGGLVRALDRAGELGCEAVQLFSGNPNGWARRPVDREQAALFRGRAAELGISPVILHTPYLLNLASPDEDIWHKSVDALSDAVARAPLLGSDRVVTHIGSHRGSGLEAGVRRVCEAVRMALDAAEGVWIALELGAGSGESIGSRFEHIADIFGCLGSAAGRVGICIDTAHLWGSGYDISTAEGVGEVFERIERCPGLNRLLVIHLNDTPVALGARVDRHQHIGKGSIGTEGFRAILADARTADLPGIIETPGESIEMDRENLTVLRRLM